MKRLFFGLILFHGLLQAQAFEKITQIPVSLPLKNALLDESHRFAFLHAPSVSSLSVVDLYQYREIRLISLPAPPIDMTISEDWLFWTSENLDRLYRMDLSKANAEWEVEAISLEQRNKSYEKILVYPLDDVQRILLYTQDGSEIHRYKSEDEGVSSEASDFVKLDFQLRDWVFENTSRVFLMGDTGRLRNFNPSNLSLLGIPLNLDAFVSNSMDPLLVGQSISNATQQLLVYDLASDQLLSVRYTPQNLNLTVLDRAPSDNTRSGLQFSESLSAGKLIENLERVDDEEVSQELLLSFNKEASKVDLISVDQSFEAGSPQVLSSIALEGNISSDGLAADQREYAYLLDDANLQLHVLSDQPYLDLNPKQFEISSQTQISVSLRSGASGRLKVFFDENVRAAEQAQPGQGTALVSESIDKDQSVDIEIDVSEFQEGANYLSFVLENGDVYGRRILEVVKDEAPPQIKDLSLSFGNQKVFARFDSLPQSDIAFYEVFFGTPASATGGASQLTSPQVLEAESYSGSIVLEGLENGREVFVKVRAVDQAGNLGPFSAVKSETPEATIGLIGLLSEKSSCASSRASHWFWLLALSMLCLLSRSNANKPKRWTLLMALCLFQQGICQETKHSRWVTASAAWWFPSSQLEDDFATTKGPDKFYVDFDQSVLKSLYLGLGLGYARASSKLLGLESMRVSGETQVIQQFPVQFKASYSPVREKGFFLKPYAQVAAGGTWVDIKEPSQQVSSWKNTVAIESGLRIVFAKNTRAAVDAKELLGIQSSFINLAINRCWSLSDGFDPCGLQAELGLGIAL